MTSNKQPNIVNKQFNKLCEPYPCVNSPLHTNSTHTGVDCSDGSLHLQPHPGWSSFPLCMQLGKDNTGPMGPTDNNGLPSRANTTAISGKPMPPNKLSSEEEEKIAMEISELLGKGAIVETQLSAESFVSQIFLVEKKGEVKDQL